MQTSNLPKKSLLEDDNVEAFVMHMTSLNPNGMPIQTAQNAQIALIVIKEVQILFKYSDFSDVFLKKKDFILLEAIELNKHAIKFQKSDK